MRVQKSLKLLVLASVMSCVAGASFGVPCHVVVDGVPSLITEVNEAQCKELHGTVQNQKSEAERERTAQAIRVNISDEAKKDCYYKDLLLKKNITEKQCFELKNNKEFLRKMAERELKSGKPSQVISESVQESKPETHVSDCYYNYSDKKILLEKDVTSEQCDVLKDAIKSDNESLKKKAAEQGVDIEIKSEPVAKPVPASEPEETLKDCYYNKDKSHLLISKVVDGKSILITGDKDLLLKQEVTNEECTTLQTDESYVKSKAIEKGFEVESVARQPSIQEVKPETTDTAATTTKFTRKQILQYCKTTVGCQGLSRKECRAQFYGCVRNFGKNDGEVK